MHARVLGGQRFGALNMLLNRGGKATLFANNRQTDIALIKFFDFAFKRHQNSSISAFTSAAGRFQFSLEKANRLSV
ncbi:hypothetical protein HAALTHF_01440n [Vreelandella aquamarina]|nr:hypothetical protein HAALTHF_01440n [Halomonas axialensis]